MADLKVVELFPSNYRDAVATLRSIADEIEAGKFGDVGCVGLVLMGDTVEVFGAGVDSEASSVAIWRRPMEAIGYYDERGDQAVGPKSPLPVTAGVDYETVAASQTDQSLGATGARGDILVGLLVVPATTSPGAVSIKDGSGSAITVFTGGASSVSNLIPFPVPLGLKSLSGAWKVTTGASVSVIAVGDFT